MLAAPDRCRALGGVRRLRRQGARDRIDDAQPSSWSPRPGASSRAAPSSTCRWSTRRGHVGAPAAHRDREEPRGRARVGRRLPRPGRRVVDGRAGRRREGRRHRLGGATTPCTSSTRRAPPGSRRCGPRQRWPRRGVDLVDAQHIRPRTRPGHVDSVGRRRVVGHSYIVYAPLLAGATHRDVRGQAGGTRRRCVCGVIQEQRLRVVHRTNAIRAIRKADPEADELAKYDIRRWTDAVRRGERLDPDT